MAFGSVAGVLLKSTVGQVAPRSAAIAGNELAFPGQVPLALNRMIMTSLSFACFSRGLAASENPEQLRCGGVMCAQHAACSTAAQAASPVARPNSEKSALSPDQISLGGGCRRR